MLFNWEDNDKQSSGIGLKGGSNDENDSFVVTNTTRKKNNFLAVTPKMSLLVGRSSLSTLLVSYFDSLKWLGTQIILEDVFGEDPVILGIQPTNNNSTNCLPRVCLYADRCKLDVFLGICQKDQVGICDGSTRIKLVHKIFLRLSLN